MSKQSKRHDFLKSLTQSVLGPRYYGDHKLSKTDSSTVLWCMKCFYCILVDVRSQWSLETKFQWLLPLIQAGNSTDIRSILSELDAADARLLASTCGEDKPFSYVDSCCSEFSKKLASLTKQITTAWNTSKDVEAFKSIHQINTFLKRTTLEDELELKTIAYDGWYEIESRNWDFEIQGPEPDILSEWFPLDRVQEAYADACPCHGNGATAEGYTDIEDKVLNLRYTHKAIELLRRCGRTDLLPDAKVALQSITISDEILAPVEDLDYCLVAFVAKSWKTFRVISSESVNTMYWQQFVGSAIENWLRSNKCDVSLHYCIDTEDRNRDFAWEGSLDGSYATIDLSSASDCVWVKLVEEWFSNTWLLDGLMLTRAGFACFEDPRTKEDRVIIQKKFAPMGSRLCFPTMTISLCAVCEAIVRRHTGAPADRYDYAVYGDDIVIRAEYAEELLDRLNQIGFIPNVRKSYYNTGGVVFFRESCGGEYLNGTDVTPLMVSRKFRGLSSLREDAYDPTVLGATIEFANSAFRFPLLRLLLTFVVDRATNKQVWRDDGTLGLFSPHANNMQLDTTAWHTDHQCMMGLALGLARRHCRTTIYRNSYDQSYSADDVYQQVLLSEYLRLTRNRLRLTFPEDLVQLELDPYNTPTAKAIWYSLSG